MLRMSWGEYTVGNKYGGNLPVKRFQWVNLYFNLGARWGLGKVLEWGLITCASVFVLLTLSKNLPGKMRWTDNL